MITSAMFTIIHRIKEVELERSQLLRDSRDFLHDAMDPKKYVDIVHNHGFRLAWHMVSAFENVPPETVTRLLMMDSRLRLREKCEIYESITKSAPTESCVRKFLLESEVTDDDIMWCRKSGVIPYLVLRDSIKSSMRMTFEAYDLLTNLGIEVHPSLNHRYEDGTKEFHTASETLLDIVMDGDDIVFPPTMNRRIFECYAANSNTSFDVLMKLAPRYDVDIARLTDLYLTRRRKISNDDAKKFVLKPDVYAYHFDADQFDILRDQQATIIPVAKNHRQGSILPKSWWDENPSIAETRIGQIRRIIWYEPNSCERILDHWHAQELGMRVGNFVRTLVEYDTYLGVLKNQLAAAEAEF